ncbi:hypothetical protein ZOSMA_66G00200 [Zostera marina]|uniref:Uncharacterized protein n=1 Tax=Zostera marina TaxID=29655 RepID=A0A0K9NS71_ZOSMR|nr:hypothetical protein ZOSMA_66G00200 [Zostera marina]
MDDCVFWKHQMYKPKIEQELDPCGSVQILNYAMHISQHKKAEQMRGEGSGG